MHLSPDMLYRQGLPPSEALQAQVAAVLETLTQKVLGCGQDLPPEVQTALPWVLSCSDFVSRSLTQDLPLLPTLLAHGDLIRSLTPADFAARAPALPSDTPIQQEVLLTELRRWRRREMVRIAWRDLAGWAALEETLADLSAFAEAALHVAAAHARHALVARHGEPRSAEGEVQPLVIVGMGKLGGGELNFSSDVDLVLLFPEHGQTDGPRPIANEEFFTRMAQGMTRLLSAPTAEGIVQRIDLRLRPFGDSGPLVASFAFLEDYLPRHGRDWERYAYVKARALSAPEHYAQLEKEIIHPFVYRRYLDYGMFASLREMKGLIERQVARRELADDVKLGPGGIREIEMIVQLFQLIRGGQNPRLRTPSLLRALAALEAVQLPPSAVQELESAYRHLRLLENRLQMLNDSQTHQLPSQPLARERIARAMGTPGWEALYVRHQAHTGCVMAHFAQVLGTGKTRPTRGVELAGLWEGEGSPEELRTELQSAGFRAEDAPEAARLLLALRSSGLVRKLETIGRSRLQALLPLLMQDLAAQPSPNALTTLRRVLRILETIGQRSTYFALLTESTVARRRLIDLCASGEFLTGEVAAHPLLLDELIGERTPVPGRAALSQELRTRMQAEGADAQIDSLAQVQRAAVFRVALADLAGALPLMVVSDQLTEIAEVVLAQALELAWQQMTAELGTPMCQDGEGLRPVELCVVGYGKLGGREMGYGSDLDLVLLHDSVGERQQTQGARSIDNALFFVRLVQRLTHLLTVQTPAGRLYEVDMRLRPSGKGGLLVTAMRAFEQYQCEQAWTWEHQALLHARAVAGSPRLCEELERVRMDVLCHHVRQETLQEEVVRMRERMRRELSRATPGHWDLKQDAGGIADIEFLAQYWALRWAHDYPPVALFSDTIRQLESVASANLIPQRTVDELTGAYRLYRARAHRLSLDARPPVVPAAELAGPRGRVTAIWDQAMKPQV